MSASILNITHSRKWIIPHEYLYETNMVNSLGRGNKVGLDDCQIYLICKRNKITFQPSDTEIPIDSNNIIKIDIVEDKGVISETYKVEINLTEYLLVHNITRDQIKVVTKYPNTTIVLVYDEENQISLGIQTLIPFVKGVDFSIFDFEVDYIGQSNSASYKITDRLKSHEKILRSYASIQKNEPHKEINIILLEIPLESPKSFMVGTFPGGADAGYDLNEKDLDNVFATNDVPFDDLVNCAEAMLIHYFKPKFNSDFKDNLLEGKLKTIKYFRDKGYKAVSFELNFRNCFFKIYSSTIGAEDFSFINYDMSSEENDTKFLNFDKI